MTVALRPDDPVPGEIARLQHALEDARRARDRALAERDAHAARLEAQGVRHAAALGGQADRLAAVVGEHAAARAALLRLERRLAARGKAEGDRLESAVWQSLRSWRGLLALPGKILGIRRRMRRTAAPQADASPALERWVEAIETTFATAGLAAAERAVRAGDADARQRAAGLVRLAKLVAATDGPSACRLGAEAVALDPRPTTRKWFGFLLHTHGAIAEADELLRSLPPALKLKPSEAARILQVAGHRRLSAGMPPLPERAPVTAYDAVADRILYLGASALPHNVSGYTLRSQAMVEALRTAGWDVVCATRPGYPQDRADAAMPGDAAGESSPAWRALPGPHRRKGGLDHYLAHSADIIEAYARDIRPAVIHAASNHEVAIPALVAARRLGVPFVYEVRGLWELTTSSSRAHWEASERFALEVRLETFAASNADAVLTLTEALADELAARGVERARIALAPNAVDASLWSPRPRDGALVARYGLAGAAFVVGYLGATVGYEGLDDLVRAVALLRDRGLDVKALIVGGGEVLGSLREQARCAGLERHVIFAGRVPPADAPAHLALLDAVALPRKPLRVCQMVSPLKPLEAMAAEIPVVVSDVAALREMVKHEVTGLVHRAGDPADLADALERLAGDPSLARSLARAARQRVLGERSWTDVARSVGGVYRRLLPARAASLAEGRPRPPAPLALPPGRTGLDAGQKIALDDKLRAAWHAGGAAGVEAFLAMQTRGRGPRFESFCMLRAAHLLAGLGDSAEATALAGRAATLDDGPRTWAGVTHLHLAMADYALADAALARVRATGGTEPALAEELDGRVRLIAEARGPARAERSAAAHPPSPRRILNVLAFSLPHSSVGYATRSHGLALGLRDRGWDMRPYTRPGFPEEGASAASEEVDGLVYRRLPGGRRGVREVAYLRSAAETLDRVTAEERPAIVHAASNYVTALPALIAARRHGLPFVYEVRGFWEMTRSVRDEVFEHTPKGRVMRRFEELVACEADRVVTITAAMRDELIARGVAPERIALVPNSVDAGRFTPSPRDEALAARLGIPSGVPVIGYVGSILDYEGLDDLAAASAALRDEGMDFRLLLVGDGAALPDLRGQIEALGLGDRAILPGRVPHEDVQGYYSLIDVAPFPRKPFAVCETVSPLKPFEAMALEKAVVVSSTRALSEIVEDGRTGLVFAKGDRSALRAALAALLAEPHRRAALGASARAWVRRERSWEAAAGCLEEVYESLIRA